MKKIIVLLSALALVFTLCSCDLAEILPEIMPNDRGNNNEQVVAQKDISDQESDDEDTFDYSSVEIEMKMGYNKDTYEEEGTVTAKDKDGNILWTYEGGKYQVAQLESYSEIGKHGTNYYYSEGGNVIALDIKTGKRVWKNEDFGGLDVKYVFGEDAMYLCGYFGPDFFAVSYDGTTLKKIETINDNYWGTRKLEQKDSKIAVYFDSSYDSNGGVAYVDTKTFEVSY